ncbi:MAG: ferric reductase-like transmembrane domain-containing protein [Candidatus Diapherotrites archaeon]|nr:ferric reductase-like transmembrane domain-containing protein [Candidatus Diapherotrites archaeon]
MQRSSEMWLIIVAGIALLAFYNAFLPGPSPATQIIRTLGLGGFFLLCVSLMIGPLVTLWPKTFAQLFEPRRAVGVSAFIFMAAHYLLVLMLYFNFDFALLSTMPQLTIAIPAFFIIFAMALTSTDWAMRVMGKNWKRLHRLVYIAFILILAHFVQVANGLPWTAQAKTLNYAEIALLLLAGIVIILQIAGFIARRKRTAQASK